MAPTASKNILVLGGAGYIGSHVCRHLAASGYRPVTVDNLRTGYLRAVRWGPMEQADIGDENLLGAIIEKHRPVAAIHMAACIEAAESIKQPSKYYRNNFSNSVVACDTLIRHGVNKLVFSGSAAVYGEPATIPIPVSQPPAPINPYGRSKLAVEWLLQDLAKAKGLKSYSLRYFNAAGAHPQGNIGEAHQPETHLIPVLMDALSGRRERFCVFGTAFPTRDGTAERDFIHVDDLATAHVLALERLLPDDSSDGWFKALNVGAGRGATVREVVTTAMEILGIDCPIGEQVKPRPGDPARLIADIKETSDHLHWSPERSDLKTIITDAWRFHDGARDAWLADGRETLPHESQPSKARRNRGVAD
ncbi:MAG: UDP-glucose 4-epimerase GalE [Alphaproteobacteria bacterium]|nr:UDP-glucose 4-epimerase GalE [Alphaproteobacteria bacterium]